MPTTPTVKPSQKAVKSYYDALARYAEQNVDNELALRSAFQNLLDHTGRRFGWTLIPELSDTAAGHRIQPDGTFRDEFLMRRGFWEAKDTHDDLEAEIQKKIKRGYPLSNIIFEDTRSAFLYQNGRQAMKVDLAAPRQLCDLLNAFFAYTEPAHEDFGRAIDDFKERVPELAQGLVAKIDEAHRDNRPFQEAFDRFFDMCRASLNPNLSRAAGDEMLVQHLLTARLIRKIFDNQDFCRRNVIAAEVEKVIDALVSRSFNRHAFLKSLDRFYLAIEQAAGTIESFTDKLHFLNVVYEQFFHGYSVKVADTHGIVYTPQEIVDFMCASVAEVLQSEFGKKLGDPGVNILDPCTGTGNFIVNLIGRIPKRSLPRMYREQLFANEIMLMPYYIAALNIEHAYFERTGEYEPFEGMCFVDTLDLAEAEQGTFGFMTERNTERVERQRKAPITIIIGNPPYNVGQINENDNNKNRKYDVIEQRIQQTYAKDSAATNKNSLMDAYVKFFRWAGDRLEGREGIVCFISNNAFVTALAFDGFRKHLLHDFTSLYHLDLGGNVRKRERGKSVSNVFGIRVGVGITIAIRSRKYTEQGAYLHRIENTLPKQQKLRWLARQQSAGRVDWHGISPDNAHTWLGPEHVDEFAGLMPIGTRAGKRSDPRDTKTVFHLYCRGLETTRDAWVYDFAEEPLKKKVLRFIEAYNTEIDRWKRAGTPRGIDAFLLYDDTKIKWSSRLKETFKRQIYGRFDQCQIRKSLYRPFAKQLVFFDSVLNHRQGLFKKFFPVPKDEEENVAIAVTDIGYRAPAISALVTNCISDLHLCAPVDAHECFPFYTYDEDGSNRRENITDWALKKFREQYANKRITKWDIFYYVYGILHHPGYRQRYAENLKRQLPRIPFAPDFKAFRDVGKELAHWHLDYEQIEPYELEWLETEGVPLSCRVEKMRLAKDKTTLKVNDSLTLAGIPPEVFDYRLGNRSGLDWVIDQYRIKTDKRSGITSDPNRADDPEYIVRLIGQVVRVSIESVRIISELPKECTPDSGKGDLGSEL